MSEAQIRQSIIIVVSAIVLGCLVAVIGLNHFLDIPVIFLLWFIIAFCATGTGHLLALIVSFITARECRRLCILISSGVLLLISLIWAETEKGGFMGNIGAGVIQGIFSLPLGASFLFWLIVSAVHLLKSKA